MVVSHRHHSASPPERHHLFTVISLCFNRQNVAITMSCRLALRKISSAKLICHPQGFVPFLCGLLLSSPQASVCHSLPERKLLPANFPSPSLMQAAPSFRTPALLLPDP